MENKEKSKAITAFVLGLFFWVPLFNIFLGIIGVAFGILALKEIKKEPERFSGTVYAIIGVVLCLLPILGGLFLLFESVFLS